MPGSIPTEPNVPAFSRRSSDAALDKFNILNQNSPIRLPSNFLNDQMKEKSSTGFGALFLPPTTVDMDLLQRQFQETFAEDFRRQVMREETSSYKRSTTLGFLDISPYLKSGVESIVQDSFTTCFELAHPDPWNFTIFLFVGYVIGVFFRYFVLLPIKLVILVAGLVFFFAATALTYMLPVESRTKYQRMALKMLASFWVASWAGVVRFHGTCPPRRPNQIFVANHSSLIDVVVLLYDQTWCLVGQRHAGIIGFLQDFVLGSMRNLWFDRMQQKDRTIVSQKIKEHIQHPEHPPLIVFPEGTCVNNDYAIMFKRGAFDLDATVIPIAIKYNKLFADPHWNSKEHSFPRHLLRIMTSWCLVCDVYYLDPITINHANNETSIQLASRAKQMICERAGLKAVPWDGYLKYYKISPKETSLRQKIFAEALIHRFALHKEDNANTIITD